MSTSLYRHFSSDGALLYVGISLSWPSRTKAHAHRSRWFDQVARVEIEQFPDREAALAAEREAIRRERPKFNVVHNRVKPKVTVRGERTRLKGLGLASSGRLLSKRDRRRLQAQYDRELGGLLEVIQGPDAIIGPALVYRDELISVLVAHGNSGTAGELTEIVLGKFYPDLPGWADACDGVITIRRPSEITINEARYDRAEIVRKLRGHLRIVEAFDTDVALAVAYASRFPSAKSRQVLDEIAVEHGTAA